MVHPTSGPTETHLLPGAPQLLGEQTIHLAVATVVAPDAVAHSVWSAVGLLRAYPTPETFQDSPLGPNNTPNLDTEESGRQSVDGFLA